MGHVALEDAPAPTDLHLHTGESKKSPIADHKLFNHKFQLLSFAVWAYLIFYSSNLNTFMPNSPSH